MMHAMWIAQVTASAPSPDTWLIAGFALIGLSVVLIALELVLPSAGMLAIAAGTSVAAGVVCFFLHSMLWGFASLALVMGGAPFAIGYVLRLWSSTPLARRAVLSTELGEDARAPLPPAGTEGVARIALRPGGRVDVAGAVFEAIAEDGFVDAGHRVRVTGHEGGSLRVVSADRS
jgi:membrane-bound ClpP family serine protease